jgi:hypothetical protein
MNETTLKVGVCSGCERRKFVIEPAAGDEQVRVCPRCEAARRHGDALAKAAPKLLSTLKAIGASCALYDDPSHDVDPYESFSLFAAMALEAVSEAEGRS